MSEPIKVWGVAVTAPAQKAAAEAHCFGDCGKISMAGAIADELTGGLFVCSEPTCPYMAREFPDYGTTMSFGRPHAITLRLLQPLAGHEPPKREVKRPYSVRLNAGLGHNQPERERACTHDR